jgi:hypothetical protein
MARTWFRAIGMRDTILWGCQLKQEKLLRP